MTAKTLPNESWKIWKIYQGDSGKLALEISDCRDFYRLEFLNEGVEFTEEQEKTRQQEIEKIRSLFLPLHKSLKNTFSRLPEELKQCHEKEEAAREDLMQYWVPFEDIQAVDRKGQDFLDIHFQARTEALKLKEEIEKGVGSTIDVLIKRPGELPEKETEALIKCFNKDKSLLNCTDFKEELGKMQEENKIDALVEKCRSRVWREYIPTEWSRGDFLASATAAYLKEHDLGSEFDSEEKMIDLLNQVNKDYLRSEPGCPFKTNVEYAVWSCKRDMEQQQQQEQETTATIRDLFTNPKFAEIDLDVYDDYVDEIGCAFVGDPDRTLTEEGEKYWKDVLDLPITVNKYGITVHIPDVDDKKMDYLADRASRFIHAVAGFCSEKNYNKWFDDGENHAVFEKGVESTIIGSAGQSCRKKENEQQKEDNPNTQWSRIIITAKNATADCILKTVNFADVTVLEAQQKLMKYYGEFIPDQTANFEFTGWQYGKNGTTVLKTLSTEEYMNMFNTIQATQNTCSLKEEKKMAEKETPKKEAKTEVLVSPKQMRYSQVRDTQCKVGYLCNVVLDAARVNEQTQETTYTGRFAICNKPLVDGKPPKDGILTFGNITASAPIDSLEAASGKKVLVTGQMFERDYKDPETKKPTGKRFDVLYAHDIAEAKEVDGKTHGGDKVVASKDCVKNALFRAGQIHIVGYVFESQFNKFNREVKDNETGETLGFAQDCTLSTKEYAKGVPVKDEKGEPVYKRLPLRFMTNEPLSSEQLANFVSSKDNLHRLSLACAIQKVNYQVNKKDENGNIIKDDKGESVKEWKYDNEIVRPMQINKFREREVGKVSANQAARPLNMEAQR